MHERNPPTRRRVLRLGAAFGVAGLAGCSGGGSGGGDDRDDSGTGDDGGDGGSDGGGGSGSSGESLDAWLDDVSNYDGSPVDHTGEETVSIAVGAGNGLLFDPPAVRVTLGTTVVWEWTGAGGQHNVKATNGAFESELASTEGTTFEWTFEEAGVVRYLCVPHQAVGMKGAVEVVDG